MVNKIYFIFAIFFFIETKTQLFVDPNFGILKKPYEDLASSLLTLENKQFFIPLFFTPKKKWISLIIETRYIQKIAFTSKNLFFFIANNICLNDEFGIVIYELILIVKNSILDLLYCTLKQFLISK